MQNHHTVLDADNTRLRTAVNAADETRIRLWQVCADLMLVARFDGVIIEINPAWTSMLGWTREELVGHDLFDLVHPDEVGDTMDGAKNLSQGIPVWRFDNRCRHKDGSYRWIAWAAVPGDGLINAVGRNATPEKEQQHAALQRSEEALRQAQKMEAVGQLTGGLAHDFNNLLTSINGSLDLLQARFAQGYSNDLGRYIATAQGATRRAAALTNRLLAFSRQQILNPRPTDVNRLITGMQELICRTLGPAITVRVVKANRLWTTWIDVNQLENGLLNLCINARDAMPLGGQLTIETINTWLPERMARECDLPMGQYVALAVSDTGSGMTPEVMARAFDPFFTTKPKDRGTGLGLSMIYGFVRQSGGQVQIESDLDRGTTVCLYLPRHVGEADEPENADQATDLADAPQARQGEAVLVVEDEVTLREIVIDVLEGLGYRTIAAADAAAGLNVLQSDARIDLMITDIGLPGGMDGQQLARVAREAHPGLKILFITGYAEDTLVNHWQLEAGMDVLIKPFAMEVLAKRINALVA